VTGGSSGIGLATAQQFALEGAYVFITGRRREQLDRALAQIGAENAGAIAGDVSSQADVAQLFRVIESEKGRLDVVFANAGGGTLSPLGKITEEEIDATFKTNVKGVVFVVQGALPLLREGASIVLNASTAGSKGAPGFSIYSASKAAVRNLARSWILDLAGRNVRVNVVSPGVVPTPGYDGLGLSAAQLEEFVSSQAKTIPSGRVGTVEDVAKAVVFLASDDSSWINGAELFVDGGMTAI